MKEFRRQIQDKLVLSRNGQMLSFAAQPGGYDAYTVGESNTRCEMHQSSRLELKLSSEEIETYRGLNSGCEHHCSVLQLQLGQRRQSSRLELKLGSEETETYRGPNSRRGHHCSVMQFTLGHQKED